MKYFDRTTKILQERNYTNQFNNDDDFFTYFRLQDKKMLKSFTKKVLQSGIDRDWWYLVSKEDRLSLARSFSIEIKDKNLDINEFINERKKSIIICKSTLRAIKLDRLLREK
jgi:hypothetical protein